MIPTDTKTDTGCRETIIRAIDAAAAELKRIALDIHAHPELGFKEYRACALWADCLETCGFKLERGIADMETAFQATAGSGNPVVAFMLEYDALPEIGHACGHHLNGAAACGAAIGLNAVLPEIPGRILAFGCPAEEGLGGKVQLVKAGLLNGITCAMMAHARDRDMGAMSHSAVAKYRVTYRGHSAHAAAAPDQAVNALDAVVLLFSGINAMRQQMRDGSRIHGVITKGGTVPNIIPDHTEALFYIRDRDDRYLNELDRRFRNIVEGAALQTGTRVEIEPYGCAYKSNVPNQALDRIYRHHAESLGIRFDPADNLASPASTDMGDVSQEVPSIHPAFQAAPYGTPIHSRDFASAAVSPEALESMLTAAKAMALTGYTVLTDCELRNRMQAELQEKHPEFGRTGK